MSATPLSWKARLVDLVTGDVLATTQSITDFSFGRGLDKIGDLSCSVPAADPGASADDSHGFAQILLQASSEHGTPRALRLDFSLDGGTAWDSSKICEMPTRSLAPSGRILTEAGPDLGSLLATLPVERATYTQVALSDALGAAPGTITPLAASGFLPYAAAIPYLAGILHPKPGLRSWAASVRSALQFRAMCNGDVAGTAINIDADSITAQALLDLICQRLAGTVANAVGYGHYCIDVSSHDLNLAHTAGYLGAGDTSDRPTVVVGHIGEEGAHLTFLASPPIDLDETTSAPIHQNQTQITAGGIALVPEVNFVGGKSDANWPVDGQVTGLTLINARAQDSAWTTCLPLIGINQKDELGGVFFSCLDGVLRAVPGSPRTPVLCLNYDEGSAGPPVRTSALHIGTPTGVYVTHAPNLVLPAPTTWTRLGSLSERVVRLQTETIPSDPDGLPSDDAGSLAIFAQVTGSKDKMDGIWRYTPHTNWVNVLAHGNIVDMISTDYKTLWLLSSADQSKVFRYGVGDSAYSPAAGFSLPSGHAQNLLRVITVSPSFDSVWAIMDNASSSPAYYKIGVAGDWSGDWWDANRDGTLKAADDNPLAVTRVAGLGLTIDGVATTAFCGTNSGLYFTKDDLDRTDGLAWTSLNDQGGLGSFTVQNIAAGDWQMVAGEPLDGIIDPDVTALRKINRLFITTSDDLIYSNSSGRWFNTLKGRDRSVVGTYLSGIYADVTASYDIDHHQKDLPPNNIRTFGSTNSDTSPMISSPLQNDSGTYLDGSTHFYVPTTLDGGATAYAGAIPDGFFWERRLDDHLDWQYRFVSQTCPLPGGTQMSQLPDLQANVSVTADRASSSVATVAYRFLRQEADPQTIMTLESSYSSQESALRTLRPSHRVSVTGSITVRDVGTGGGVVATHVVDYTDAPFYVLDITQKKGTGMTVTCQVTLGTRLLTAPVSEADIMAASQDAIHVTRVWGHR